MTYKESLEAIIARYNGDWDSPALMKFGPLSTNADEDMYHIARAALDAYQFGETRNT